MLSLTSFSQRNVIADSASDKATELDRYYQLAQKHNELDEYNESIIYLLKSLDISEQLNIVKYDSQIYLSLAKAYANTNQYSLAYKYQVLYSQLSDSLTNKTNQETKLLFDEQRKIIEDQKKDALHQQAIKIHRNERKYIFSTLLVILILGAIFSRNYLRKRKHNKSLSKQKREIEIQAKELSDSNKKLLRLAKFKQDMTNMIVHDLKNPISAIINVSKIDDWPDKDLMIEYSGKQLLNLVTNILDVDKYEQMDFKLFKREVNIQKSINIALEDVSFILKNKGINIELNLVENSCVIADREIINRVLVNLLTNAIKFSPNNGTIAITASIKNQDELYVGIKNDGPGIQKDMHKSIFEMYQQHDVRPSGGVASSGIGLSFCKLSIEAHNGEIGVKSETKTGVEFWFTLPNAEIIQN